MGRAVPRVRTLFIVASSTCCRTVTVAYTTSGQWQPRARTHSTMPVSALDMSLCIRGISDTVVRALGEAKHQKATTDPRACSIPAGSSGARMAGHVSRTPTAQSGPAGSPGFHRPPACVRVPRYCHDRVGTKPRCENSLRNLLPRYGFEQTCHCAHAPAGLMAPAALLTEVSCRYELLGPARPCSKDWSIPLLLGCTNTGNAPIGCYLLSYRWTHWDWSQPWFDNIEGLLSDRQLDQSQLSCPHDRVYKTGWSSCLFSDHSGGGRRAEKGGRVRGPWGAKQHGNHDVTARVNGALHSDATPYHFFGGLCGGVHTGTASALLPISVRSQAVSIPRRTWGPINDH